MWRYFTLIFLLFGLTFDTCAQENVQGRFYQLGFNFGYASVDNFIFKDDDYYYEVYLHKIQILYRIKSGKIDYDFIFQPEINRAHHKLYNPWFAGHPDVFSEYRTQLMTLKTINEYIMNCGVILRTSITENLNIYGLASLGPGYFDEGSERMAKGIGFSKFVSFGNKADISEIDLMYYLMHDDSTRVILLYLEEVRDGRALMAAAQRPAPGRGGDLRAQ